MRNRLVVGAGVKCYINNVDIGIVSAIQWTLASVRDEERGLDSLDPFELSPTQTSVTATVQVYRVRDDSGLEGYGIIKPPRQIPNDEYFTLELKDRVSGSTYLKIDHAAVDNQAWSVSAKGVLTGQFSCHGLIAKTSFRG